MHISKYLPYCLVFTAIYLISAPAYAYLDPGTGSVLLQGLLAGFAGVIAVLKLYWRRVKQFFWDVKNKICSKPMTENSDNRPSNNP